MKKLLAIMVLGLLWSVTAHSKSKLPILECLINNPNGSKDTQIYDLSELERLDPTNGFSTEEYQKFNKKNREYTSVNAFENEYRIQYRNTFNGQTAGYLVTINRKTGELDATILKKHSVDTPFKEMLEIVADAPKYKGICNISKNKKL